MSSCEKCRWFRIAKVANLCKECNDALKLSYDELDEKTKFEVLETDQKHEANLKTLETLRKQVKENGFHLCRYINPSFCSQVGCNDRTCVDYRGKHTMLTPYLDHDICLKAVSAPNGDPRVIRYIPEHLKSKELCKAVLENPKIHSLIESEMDSVIGGLPTNQPYSEEIYLEACKFYPRTPFFFPDRLSIFEVYNKAIKVNPDCLQYTPLRNRDLTTHLIMAYGMNTKLIY